MNFLDKYANTDFSSYEDFHDNFQINVPDQFNFAYDIVDEYARLEPEKKALVWCDEKGNKATFTFADMKYYSDKAANFYRSIGLKKGDSVMLILKRKYQYWFALVGLHKIGAIAIPATHLLTKKDIVYRNNAAHVKAIVATADSHVADAIDEAAPDSPTLQYKILSDGKRDGWLCFEDELEKAAPDFIRPVGKEATQNHDLMLLYFTSGTTGYPKMVTHNYAYPLGHILTAHFWQKVEDDRLHLTVSDTGWAKAAWGKIYGQWICGATVFAYDYERFIPHDLLTIMQDYKITTFCAPPTIYRFFIKEDLTKYDLSSLHHCCIAGEPLNPEIYNQFLKMTGHKLYEGFGQTEMCVALATFEWFEPKPGSMGKPVPTYNIDIVDENNDSCDVGQEGEIVLRLGDEHPIGLFEGYYEDSNRTTSVWYDGIYHTGDIVWRDEDGFFWFVGRTDDVIKSSGYRIGPFEVESALLEHPAVLETAITAVPDPERGQIVKATIVLAKGYTPSDELKKELQAHVKQSTAPYKYPRVIEFVDELPKTISGKIRHVAIREKDAK